MALKRNFMRGTVLSFKHSVASMAPKVYCDFPLLLLFTAQFGNGGVACVGSFRFSTQTRFAILDSMHLLSCLKSLLTFWVFPKVSLSRYVESCDWNLLANCKRSKATTTDFSKQWSLLDWGHFNMWVYKTSFFRLPSSPAVRARYYDLAATRSRPYGFLLPSS